jgi:hypothetical protein
MDTSPSWLCFVLMQGSQWRYMPSSLKLSLHWDPPPLDFDAQIRNLIALLVSGPNHPNFPSLLGYHVGSSMLMCVRSLKPLTHPSLPLPHPGCLLWFASISLDSTNVVYIMSFTLVPLSIVWITSYIYLQNTSQEIDTSSYIIISHKVVNHWSSKGDHHTLLIT